MFSVEELVAGVNRLKKSPGFVANNFLTLPAMTELAGEESAFLQTSDRAVALLCEDKGVCRLHFYLASPDAAPELQKLADKARGPVAVDCVGRWEQAGPLSEALTAAGFKPYTTLSRYRSPALKTFSGPLVEDEAFGPCSPEEADEALDLLWTIFDPLVSHLPDREALLALIREGLVFRALKNGKIVAVVCFEKKGRHSLYLYQDAVLQEYQSTGVGVLLLHYAVNRYQGYQTYTTWIEDRNRASIRMQTAMGLTLDGLRDAVMVYR